MYLYIINLKFKKASVDIYVGFYFSDNNNRTTKISATIQKLALDGINYLDSRTEFWRQQKPMYSRKRDKEMRDRDARRGSGRGARGDAAKYVLKNLEEIDQGNKFLEVHSIFS